MKLKAFIRVLGFAALFSVVLFAQTEEIVCQNPENPDCIYEKARLGDCLIHMAKITSPSKGSAPAVEILFTSDFKWAPCPPHEGWGKKGKTYQYREAEVPGSSVFLGITNKINDVVYFKVEGVHPFDLPH